MFCFADVRIFLVFLTLQIYLKHLMCHILFFRFVRFGRFADVCQFSDFTNVSDVSDVSDLQIFRGFSFFHFPDCLICPMFQFVSDV